MKTLKCGKDVLKFEVVLSRRKIFTEKNEINLSNYDIEHLRKISDSKSFCDETAENSVEKLLEKQILPFIQDSYRSLNKEEVEKEIEEAFSSHLYVFANE